LPEITACYNQAPTVRLIIQHISHGELIYQRIHTTQKSSQWLINKIWRLFKLWL